MSMAKEYGADRIWIVNVGHLKHLLLPMEFFLQFGYDTTRWNSGNLSDYTRLWAAREFGDRYAKEIAEIVDSYTRFNSRRKPELLEPGIYSQTDYREAERIVSDFRAIETKAERISAKLPQEARDAFYELVWFPAKACAQVNEMYVAAGKNALYAQQKRAATNDLADRVKGLFDADAALMDHYNRTFAGGKWNHFMDQVHIGYTIWQDPAKNIMPKVTRIEPPAHAWMGIAVEGSSSSWPGNLPNPVLPAFDSFFRQRRYVDVFNRGQKPFAYKATPRQSWLLLSSSQGTVEKEARIWVDIDWSKAPKGVANGAIDISGPDSASVTIEVSTLNPTSVTRESLDGFVQGDGYVSIEAEHFSRNVPTRSARWERIDGYGRTRSAMSIFPMTASGASPPQNSPRLEYRMYLFDPQKVDVWVTVAPTLNLMPDRGLRYGIAFDDQPPHIIDIVPQGFDARNGNREWEESVRNVCRKVRSTHTLSGTGYHTLKIWMVDPGVVLQKIVVDLGGMRPSYLGPPESYRRVKE
jgi:hypothetical protein